MLTMPLLAPIACALTIFVDDDFLAAELFNDSRRNRCAFNPRLTNGRMGTISNQQDIIKFNRFTNLIGKPVNINRPADLRSILFAAAADNCIHNRFLQPSLRFSARDADIGSIDGENWLTAKHPTFRRRATNIIAARLGYGQARFLRIEMRSVSLADKHGIAEGIESVVLLFGDFIGGQQTFAADESRQHHQQSRLGQVKVGEHGIHGPP